MASLVQDVWLGGAPRLRGRRLAPYDEPPVRLIFHPDLGSTLDDPELSTFLETLGARVDVVAFEPRGQGGSGGRFGPEAVEDLKALVASAPQRWPDGRPLVLAGHGVGAALALATAGQAPVRAAVALAPVVPDFFGSEAWGQHLRNLALPLLAVAPRAGGADVATVEALTAHPRAAVLIIPGDRLAPLRSPWVEMAAGWAAEQAAASPPG